MLNLKRRINGLKAVKRYAAEGVMEMARDLKKRGTTYREVFNSELTESGAEGWEAGYCCALNGIINLMKEQEGEL